MRIKFEKIPSEQGQSFFINRETVPYFTSPLHYHPEIEILLVLQGTGNLFIGESVQAYSPGHLVMIGKNVPHVWLNHKQHYKKDGPTAEAVYIQFNQSFLGESFWQLPEMENIPQLFSRAKRGIKMLEKALPQAKSLILQLEKAIKHQRITLLIELLECFANKNNTNTILDENIEELMKTTDVERMDKIFNYLSSNFREPLSLKQAANEAHMAPTAFCRYFKERTHKTFSTFLKELRIGYACQQLKETEESVNEICYDSGYSNFSNFSRQFKELMNCSPGVYRKKHK